MRHRKSLAEVVREAVNEYVAEPELHPDELIDDPFFSVIGIGQSSKTDQAPDPDHDTELYGKKR